MNAVINPSKLFDCRLDHGLYGSFIRDIYLNYNSTEIRIFGELLAFFDDRVGIIQISQDSAVCAGFCEGQGCLLANSCRSLFDDNE